MHREKDMCIYLYIFVDETLLHTFPSSWLTIITRICNIIMRYNWLDFWRFMGSCSVRKETKWKISVSHFQGFYLVVLHFVIPSFPLLHNLETYPLDWTCDKIHKQYMDPCSIQELENSSWKASATMESNGAITRSAMWPAVYNNTWWSGSFCDSLIVHSCCTELQWCCEMQYLEPPFHTNIVSCLNIVWLYNY